jgi:thioredoxin-related protein
MKFNSKLVVSILIFVSIFTKLYSQQKNKTRPIFSGTFQYTQGQPDNIMLWTYPKNETKETATDYSLEINKENKFRIILPIINKPLRFQLVFIKDGKAKQMGVYFAEPNDEIHLKVIRLLEKDSLYFSGKGAEKYNLAKELNDRYYKNMGFGNLPKSIKSLDSLRTILDAVTSFYTKQQANKFILINNAKNLSADMKKLMSFEYAPFNALWFDKMEWIYNSCKENENLKSMVREHFNVHCSEMLLDTNKVSLLSAFYFQVTNNSYKTKQLISGRKSSVDLKDHYDFLKSSFSTEIRERFIIELFNGPYGYSHLSNIEPAIKDSLILDASKYFISEQGLKLIRNQLTFKKGAPLFNADFVDLNGARFNTSSLKGKVFLLEMWGLGCTACAGFHALFEKELWPKLKFKKDFAVLSIFDGKVKENWVKGINSNRYTSDEYINIATLPLGSKDHPFFNYYKVNYAPFMMLVDKKGRIIAQIPVTIPNDELLGLIDKALLEGTETIN